MKINQCFSFVAKIIVFILVPLSSASALDRLTTTAEIFENKSQWDMLRHYKDDSCAAVSSFDNQTDMMLIWRPREERMFIAIHKPSLESIKEGENYDIEVNFTKGKVYDDGWGKRSAFGSKDSDGVPGFTVSLKGPEALTDLAGSNIISFWYKEKLIASLSLKGSALMVSELRRCSKDIVRNHPVDPFEE